MNLKQRSGCTLGCAGLETLGVQGLCREMRFHCLFAFLFVLGCGGPETPPAGDAMPPARPSPQPTQIDAVPADEIPTVVFLGDSLTAGFQLSLEEALPGQVAAVLAEQGAPINAVNAGVSGDTTANGLARFDWSVAQTGADVLVVALGANDFLLGQSAEGAKANLVAIIDQALALNMEVVLAGVEPRSEAGNDARAAAFAAIYPEIATTYGLPLRPALMAGVRSSPDLLLADGLHPNAEGVSVMADGLASILLPLLDSGGPAEE